MLHQHVCTWVAIDISPPSNRQPSQTRAIAWRTRAPGPPEPARQINSSLLLIYELLSLLISKMGGKMTVSPANLFFGPKHRERRNCAAKAGVMRDRRRTCRPASLSAASPEWLDPPCQGSRDVGTSNRRDDAALCFLSPKNSCPPDVAPSGPCEPIRQHVLGSASFVFMRVW